MEEWQQKHIKDNLPKLISFTECNVSLLAAFESQKILSTEEIEKIEGGETNTAKSKMLYNFLPKRIHSYHVLISALQSTCQSGAAEILKGGSKSNRSIKFHGASTSIIELLPTLDENVTQEIHSLQQKDVSFDEVVVRNMIPDKPNYYIPRNIVARRQLHESLFQENCSDIFLFQGLEWCDLTLLVEEFSTEESSNLLDPSNQVKARHILLESLEHFDIIANKTKEPVHLIQCTNELYHWVKSSGAVQTLLKFVKENSDSMEEEIFIDEVLKDNISICLADSPGMGKTVLLASLARALVLRYPKRLVMFVHLCEFIPILQGRLINEKQLDSHLILSLLSEISSDHSVGQRIVSEKLANEHSHLFFDGFDEVLPEHRKVAKEMLKVIANSFQKCQTFVTARLHMRQELEETMGTIGYDIAPFSMDNKTEFFEKFWNCHKTENVTVQYAENCIETLADQMSEREQNIAGTPLQCYMIGEVLKKKAKSESTDWIYHEVPIISIAELYDKFIDTKLKFGAVKANCNKKLLLQAHIYSAMGLIFPEEVSNFVKYPTNVTYDQLFSAEIIENANTGAAPVIRFVHRTFAKFFVGLFAVKLFQKNDNESFRFLKEKILATSESHKYKYFIDNQVNWFKIDSNLVYRRPVVAYFVNYKLNQ